MMRRKVAALLLTGAMSVSLLAGYGSVALAEETVVETEIETEAESSDFLVLKEQGMFSAGGTVITSEGTFDVNNYYMSREGSTSHVDHANVLYQIPKNDTELPMVFLHGYGQ